MLQATTTCTGYYLHQSHYGGCGGGCERLKGGKGEDHMRKEIGVGEGQGRLAVSRVSSSKTSLKCVH